jgi:hypothetical protein
MEEEFDSVAIDQEYLKQLASGNKKAIFSTTTGQK